MAANAPDRRTDRLRRTVTQHVGLVVVVLVLLGLVGGYATYSAHAAPGVTEREVVSTWESTGAFHHQARVSNGTAAFPEGTVLSNRSVYFSRATPRLNGTFSYRFAASDGGTLRTNTSLALAVRSVETDREGNETVYWEVTRQLKAASTDDLSPGERVRIPFSANLRAASERAETIQAQLGDPPGNPQARIVADVETAGTVNGRDVAETRRYSLPVRFERNVFRVDDPGPVSETDRQTRRVAVPATAGPLTGFGGPLLLVGATAGLAGVVLGRRNGHLESSEAEREWLDYRSDRREFDEWITTGQVSHAAGGNPFVEVDSLAGLVDTAIDTNERVIEDEGRGQYVVLGGDTDFVYSPPPPPDAPADRASEPRLDLANGSKAGSDRDDESALTDGVEQTD